MKIMALKESLMCDRELQNVKKCLNECIERMKGKYGTSEAVSNLECAVIYVNQCISDDKYHTRFYQQFRNPPNTPKSRRLGWFNPTIQSLGWYKK
jgi:hypothetical protein